MKTPIAVDWNRNGSVKYFSSVEDLKTHLATNGSAAANVNGTPHRLVLINGEIQTQEWKHLFSKGENNWLPTFP